MGLSPSTGLSLSKFSRAVFHLLCLPRRVSIFHLPERWLARRVTGSHTPCCGSATTAPSSVERFGAHLAVQNFGDFWMSQIGHCAEGLLPFYKLRAIKLADAMDELRGRCSRLHDERGRSPARLFRNLR